MAVVLAVTHLMALPVDRVVQPVLMAWELAVLVIRLALSHLKVIKAGMATVIVVVEVEVVLVR
ncbi:MAG: hypothetical protein EBS91_08435 [Betaproteobacteria bacterium]|nr:hypothetical protein [Betaproteobacteria bacterium]